MLRSSKQRTTQKVSVSLNGIENSSLMIVPLAFDSLKALRSISFLAAIFLSASGLSLGP
jgi:hypothetical protein